MARRNKDAALQGTLIHVELADLMRAQKMSNVGIEVSYDATGVVKYGTKGSVRADYSVYAGGKVVRVFDLKPNDFINPTWVQKASRYIQLSPDEIEAISYEAFK